MNYYVTTNRKKVLFTTVPVSSISLVNHVPGQKIDLNALRTVEDCLLLANNESFQSGKIQPAIGLHFLKENLPTINILEYPTWNEYEEALKNQYDIVAIGFYTLNYYDAIKMAALAKQSGVKEVWAGNYGALTPGTSDHFDRLIIGRPERELAWELENKHLSRIRHPILTTPFRVLAHEEEAGFLMTYRGCTFNCQFCSTSYFSPGVEQTDIHEIERVLDIYSAMGIRYIIIFDETFLQNRRHAQKTIDLLHQRSMRWFCTTRADLIAGHARELAAQGLDGVYMGIESLNDANLTDQNKGETVTRITAAITDLTQNGISVSGTYILGLLHDTWDSIMQDLRSLQELPLFVLIFLVLTPYPELPLYRDWKSRGLIINNDWQAYDGMNLVFDHPHLSVEEMREIFEYAVFHVYSPYNYNKRRVLQRLNRIMNNQWSEEYRHEAVDQ